MCEIMGTPYDNVFKTLLIECSGLIIPVINEVFRENHARDEKIVFSQNELFMVKQNGNEDEKITDSCFNFAESPDRKYHLECQSSADGSILIRMFEYDTQIALNNSELDNISHILTATFPQSAVLYLRHTKNTPNVMKTVINTPGGSVEYEIPALKVQTYSIDEIFNKNLLFLIPFYIFSYEKEFDKMESDKECLEEVKRTYQSIMARLDRLCISGVVNEYEMQTIIDMSKRVLKGIAGKYDNVREGVEHIMGGHVIDFPAKRIKDAAMKEGYERGLEQGSEQLERVNKLNVELIKRGRSEDVIRAAEDFEYQKKLMEEFGI